MLNNFTILTLSRNGKDFSDEQFVMTFTFHYGV